MADLPYSLEPAPGYNKYTLTAALRDYLGMLMQEPGNEEEIGQILGLVDGYTAQLKELRTRNRVETTGEVYKAIDNFFNKAPQENKKEIQCREGCTACCFVEIDVSADEAATIIDHCRKNDVEIDREYLTKQASAGRKVFSEISRCVFLKDNLCSIYTVRPVACRKHWIKSDPAFCDSSKNITNPVNRYFDINAEILASAMFNVAETKPLEQALLDELDGKGDWGIGN